MKRLLLILLPLFFLLIYAGCKSDSGGTTTDPFGGGGGGGNNTGNVTFTTAIVQNNQNQTYFEFKPSTGVVVTKIAAKCPALNINDEINDADIVDDVFSSTQPLYVGPITVNLQTGQAWAFTFSGKIGSTTGQAFTSSFNYSVP
ncbi:MAG: hypothetical protein NTX22_02290 [Ignavibacteriales bacterium]|nr:hypothetical protein [Ignavibacteriales bacterium]